MSTKAKELAAVQRGEGCLGGSQDDEPVFILCARDQTASEVVRDWARRFLAIRMDLDTYDVRAQAKWREALDCAKQMDDWRDAHLGGKVPD